MKTDRHNCKHKKEEVMKHAQKTALVILSLCLVIIAGACSKKQEATTGIKLGATIPLTGDLAAWGNREKNGILLALEEVNATRTPANRFNVIIEDTKSQPAGGVTALNKLISVDKVKFFIGDVSSGIALAMAPIAESNHVVMLSPGASNPALTSAGDYIFRNWPSDVYDGAALAYAAKNVLKANKALVFYEDNTYSEGLADAFKQKAAKIGLQIVGSERVAAKDKSYRTVLEKYRNSDADIVFVAAHPEMSARIFIQMKEVGLKQKELGCVAIEGPEFVKAYPDVTNIYFTTIPLDAAHNSVFKAFSAKYREKYGEDPDVEAAHAYDAMKMFAAVIPDASTTADQAKAGLYQMKNFHGATGIMSFDSNGDVIKPLALMRYDHGKAKLVKILPADKL